MEARKENIEWRAPDGGWGYVIVAATVVVFSVTIIPMAAFGLVYGDFLKGIGDETTGTALTNGMFNTVNSFTGLIANGLLNRYTYRKVGFMGSVLFITGASALIFAQDLVQLIIFFGVVQGVGFGLLMPSLMSAFNLYFDKKMNVMMSIAQACIVAFSMMMPQLAAWSMTTFGFRGTLLGIALMSCLCIPSVAALQPVKFHLKKTEVYTINNSTVISMESLNKSKKSLPTDILKAQIEPLMHQQNHMATSQRSLNSGVVHHLRPRRSIVSLGDRVSSVTAINETREEEHEERQKDLKNENSSIWQSFLKSMDLSLLKDPKYLNVSIGLSLCFSGDLIFISIIPLMLGNIGFKSDEIATMVGVFFACDLTSRILLTLVSYAVTFRNRSLVLLASVFIVMARTALISNDQYMWKLVFLGVLGFLRCFIQTPLPLVLSEEYPYKFASAFSLFMAVNGMVSLVLAPLMSLVKSYTQSDVMTCHLLTLAYIICVFSWTLELTICRGKAGTKQSK